MQTRLISLTLFSIAVSAPSAIGANIVVNPGFESGFLPGWVVNNNVSPWFIDSIPNSGLNDIANQCGGAGCLDSLNGAFFYQDLPTVTGNTYTLTFWAFVEGAPGQTDEIKVTWGGNTVLDILNPAVPDDVYFQYSVSNLLATSSTTRLKFFGRDDPGILGVDDISVSTPEPSTLLMMGAALLIVAGLRSRHLILSSIPAVAPSKRSSR
jgi:hypothetical protein